LFAYFTRKHFNLNDGVTVILEECDVNLIYLNVYRKNHLKQLMHMTNASKKSNHKDEEMPSAFEHNISNKLTSNLIEKAKYAL
jgi:hypothetical protein